MKKVLCSLLMIIAMLNMSMVVFAETKSTTVSYSGTGTESYLVTVPATITVNTSGTAASGTVTVEGTWAENRVLNVVCSSSVVLTNSIKSSDTKELAVTFAGIHKSGSNTAPILTTDTGASGIISVANISDALFGTWSGNITYTITLTDAD